MSYKKPSAEPSKEISNKKLNISQKWWFWVIISIVILLIVAGIVLGIILSRNNESIISTRSVETSSLTVNSSQSSGSMLFSSSSQQQQSSISPITSSSQPVASSSQQVIASSSQPPIASSSVPPLVCLPNQTLGTVTRFTGQYGVAGFTNSNLLNSTYRNTVGVAYDPSSCILYIADTENNAVRAVNILSNTVISVVNQLGIAGCTLNTLSNGAISTNLRFPNGLFLDDRGPQGKFLLICDFANNRVLEYNPGNNSTILWAGSSSVSCSDGLPTGSTFRTNTALRSPTSIVKNSRGEYYIACYSVSTAGYIARVNTSGIVSAIIGNSNAISPPNFPPLEVGNNGAVGLATQRVVIRECSGLAIDPNDNLYFISNTLSVFRVGIYQNPSGLDTANTTRVLAMSNIDIGPLIFRSLYWSPKRNVLFIGVAGGSIYSIAFIGAPLVLITQFPSNPSTNTGDGGSFGSARFTSIEGMAGDPTGDNLFVTLGAGNGNAVRRLTIN